jgi:serine/threonine protein kinase
MPSTVDVPHTDELELLRATTLGEYEIIGELGRGGMATVYLAHDIALDRQVAIKVISPSLGASPPLVERFRREARTAASLSHPNIIPIYAVRHSDRLLYFVMKYVEGRPLDGILRQHGALPLNMVQAILGQVAGAVGYAHRRGVVHRDIKPGNILIDDEGWCVVTDFGIAKVAESEGLTTSGVMVGTPAYMSPEQCLSNDVSGATDQYALGVLAYEMLTGRLPFPGSSMMSVMYAHVHVPVPAIESLRSEVPPELSGAIMRMLAKEPADRWPSVEEAAAALGTVSATQEEPTRSQLITLATSGSRPPVVRHTTPRSPMPFPRPSGLAEAKTIQIAEHAPSRRTLGLAVGGGAALVALAIYFAPWRQGQAAPAAAAEGTASTGQAQLGSPQGAPVPTGPDVAPNGAASDGNPRQADGAQQPANPTTPPFGEEAAPAAPAPLQAAPAVAIAAVDMEQPVEEAPPRDVSGNEALLNRVGPPAPVPPETRSAIERAVMGYAQALALGDAEDAIKRYPAMPDFRREQLRQRVATGGRYSTRWKLSDVRVAGNTADVQLNGSTTEINGATFGGTRVVNERILLELRRSGWVLMQIAQ